MKNNMKNPSLKIYLNMQLINLILATVKFILFIVLNNLLWLQVIVGMLLISIFLYSLKHKKNKDNHPIRVDVYKIENPILTIGIFLFLFTLMILTLMTIRFTNMGKEVDLKILYKTLKSYLIITNGLTLSINIIFLLGIISLIILIFNFINNKTYTTFTKIHVYFMGNAWYSINVRRLFIRYDSILYNLYNKWLQFKYKKHNTANTFDSYMSLIMRHKKTFRLLKRIDAHLGLILIVSCLLYDLVFNHLVLSHIYYVFPIAYLLILWQKFISFCYKRDMSMDEKTNTYFYKKPLALSQGTLVYESNLELDDDDIQDIHQYILNDFKMNLNNTKVIDGIFKRMNDP
jgi:hypothetical protein